MERILTAKARIQKTVTILPDGLSAEKVTNGDFSGGLTGWSIFGTVGLNGQSVDIGDPEGGTGEISQNILTSGKTYFFSISSIYNPYAYTLAVSASTNSVFFSEDSGVFSGFIVANGSNFKISTSGYINIDDISVKEVTPGGIQAKAFIQYLRQKLLTAKARIRQNSITKTIIAKASVKKLNVTRTLFSKANIKQLNVSNNIIAKASVKKIVNRIVSAKAAVYKQITQLIQVKSSIQQTVEKMISARARLTVLSSQIISAKAKIQTIVILDRVNVLPYNVEVKQNGVSKEHQIEVRANQFKNQAIVITKQ